MNKFVLGNFKMNESIFIESRPVIFGFEHFYLFFKDNSGNETVIRDDPENDNPLAFGSINV